MKAESRTKGSSFLMSILLRQSVAHIATHTAMPLKGSELFRYSVASLNLKKLPAAGLHEVLLFDGCGGEAFHAADDGLGGFGDDLGVVIVQGCENDRAGS